MIIYPCNAPGAPCVPRMREIKNVVIMIIARPLRPWPVSGVQSYHQECRDIRGGTSRHEHKNWKTV